MIKGKKKIDIDLLVWAMTIIALVLCIVVIKLYAGIYKIEFFAIILLLIPMIYMYFVGDNKRKQVGIIICSMLLFFISIMIICTLPKYTYNGAKKLLLKEQPNIDIVKLKGKEKLKKSNEEPLNAFVRDRLYYFEDKNTKQGYSVNHKRKN